MQNLPFLLYGKVNRRYEYENLTILTVPFVVVLESFSDANFLWNYLPTIGNKSATMPKFASSNNKNN
jgi:hypothetical protein